MQSPPSIHFFAAKSIVQADLEIEGHPLNMQLDMGAAVSIISDKTHTSLSTCSQTAIPVNSSLSESLYWRAYQSYGKLQLISSDSGG